MESSSAPVGRHDSSNGHTEVTLKQSEGSEDIEGEGRVVSGADDGNRTRAIQLITSVAETLNAESGRFVNAPTKPLPLPQLRDESK